MKKRSYILLLVCILVCSMLFSACGRKKDETENKKEKVKTEEQEKPKPQELVINDEPEEPEEPELKTNGITIVIDPGHSGVVESKQEPIGPGAYETKPGDSGGTSGVATGIPEYVYNLNVALKLKAELEARGYTVVMTRESNDQPRSCIERAEIMNGANAMACVRIHANGSVNQGARGAMTICTTPGNPYAPNLYAESRRLSDCVLNRMVEATGCISEGVWETDTMSGNNWSQIPVTIVETGYMTNPEEDTLLATEEYQNLIVQGIANGIDEFAGQ